MSRYRVVIGGSRFFDDYNKFKKIVDEILLSLNKKHITVLTGHCCGADTMGEIYAVENNHHLKICRVEFEKYGDSAGKIRNEKMVKSSDCVIVFWDNRSYDALNLVELAKQYDKTLFIKDTL